MKDNMIIGILVCLSGLFSILASIFNWDFFFNSRKAQFFVKIVGRGGARIFYVILGLFIAVLGGLLGAGVIH